MDESGSLGDAEMRFVTVNGQTVMLEGDLSKVCVTNGLLDEMLLIENAKNDNGDHCDIELNGNSCANGLRTVDDDPTKIKLTIQGENDELQTIQIGMDEAKELGLYIYGVESERLEEWNEPCTTSNGSLESQEQVSVVSINNVNGSANPDETEPVSKVNFKSMPLLEGESNEKEDSILLQTAVQEKENIINGGLNSDFNSDDNSQKPVVQEENSSDNFPAIGHLEDFQIPTAADGTLLPATVNAKMADGSYQMLTLIPHVGDGNVTYSVQFANLDSDDVDLKNVNVDNLVDNDEQYNLNSISNGVNDKDVKKSKKSVVEEFLKSVQLKKKVENANNVDAVSLTDNKNTHANFASISINEDSCKLNSNSNFTVPDNFNFDNLSVNYIQQNQIPIEAKIDNLISENENVIANCKKVKYGKKIRQTDVTETNEILQNIDNLSRGSLVRGKKVKFKNRGGAKSLDDESDDKKGKLSLLKPNNEQVQENKDDVQRTEAKCNKGTANSNKNLISHMNRNCRLEYPNLKALEESESIPYFKMKTQTSPKQPYFNVLPYPKDKAATQRQYLPLNCDIQQAKNLISLQKFLETQKLQLKIQPMNSSSNKMVNIRPKPTLNDQLKTLQDLGIATPVINGDRIINNNGVSFIQTAGNQETKNNFEIEPKVRVKNSKDVLLGSDGKMNVMKFLNNEQNRDSEEEVSNGFDGKINGIFIKNNPEYFQKSKDGKAEEHPLGSTENPIQLVQTGHTFHSRQPLSETQLRQIASILQKQKFDSQNLRRNSIFDPKTNTRIVYRVVYPDDVELKKSDENFMENTIKRKRGRHKTKGDDDMQKPLGKGARKPKRLALSSLDEEILEEDVLEPQLEKKIPRTRSGRLSRPPRYMVKDYKRIQGAEIADKNPNTNYESDEAYTEYVNEKELTKERPNKIEDLENNLLPGLRSPTRSKRNFKPEYRCPTCHKIYLGHSRMMWHLNKFPDHCNAEKYKEIYSRKPAETKVRRAARRFNMCDMSSNVKQVLSSMSKDELTSLCGPLLAEAFTTWDFLLLRINLVKDDTKREVDALLNELALLFEKLTKMAEDIFLPVFTKEEKDIDSVEIDRMEIAIALGLPVGFYKINNDNLNLLKVPLKNTFPEKEEKESADNKTVNGEEDIPLKTASIEEKFEGQSFLDKQEKWDKQNDEKKIEDDFWIDKKTNECNNWQQTDNSASSVKALATKFEPNLSTKLLESSNDSIDDAKFEEPVQLIDLDSNSKDVEHSNSSENLDRSPETNIKNHSENSESTDEKTVPEPVSIEKESLWDGQSQDKEIWNEKTGLSELGEKRELWNENSGINASEKVDETNSEFLDSFLGVDNLGSESNAFLADSLLNDKDSTQKVVVDAAKKGRKKRGENFIRIWDSEKNGEWIKEEEEEEEADLLSGSIHERMPGLRTATRLTSTPETNGNINFSIPNRRNSISDFSNINLEPGGLDSLVLPPAKTLIKERGTKPDSLDKIGGETFPMKNNVFENADNYKMKNWNAETSKGDFAGANVHSEDYMKIAFESLTSHNDVITVPQTSFDSAMGILNPAQEGGNLNLFTSSEADGLDFNLPLPDNLLRTNFTTNNSFTSSTFQTTCTSNFSNTVSPTFLSTGSNLFGTTTSSSMDQFDANYQNKKAEDDDMEFFDSKIPYTSYDGVIDGGGNVTNFSFVSTSSQSDQYSVTKCLNDSIVSAFVPEAGKKNGRISKTRVKKSPKEGKRSGKVKKVKSKKTVDYPKSNSIESIINEALFDSCATQCSKSNAIQIENSSPNGGTAIPNGTEKYSLPIIPESLDEVGNLDFLNQD